MRRGSTWAVFVAAVVGFAVLTATAASAPGKTVVAGAGYSPLSGFVVMSAHTTGPQVDLTAPAAGKIRVKGSRYYGDLTGSVTCIGTARDEMEAVSGVLDTPIVIDGWSYSTFSFLVPGTGGTGMMVGLYLKLSQDPSMFDCGVNLFFADEAWAGGPFPGTLDTTPYRLQRGRFTVNSVAAGSAS